VVDDYLVPVAIPLLLLQADVRRIVRESGSLFVAFHLAALGSLLGAVLAMGLFRTLVERAPELAGIMAASYIGGSVNFVAVRATYQVPAALGNPLIVADNFIMAMMFAVLIVFAGAGWMRAAATRTRIRSKATASIRASSTPGTGVRRKSRSSTSPRPWRWRSRWRRPAWPRPAGRRVRWPPRSCCP
jgi:uncharacterized membrane protein